MFRVLISVYTIIAPEAAEKLEDALRDCLEQFGVIATIDDRLTGNTTRTRTEREQVRQLFIERARDPPWDALPWSSAWEEYVEEMHELERQLRGAGEDL